MQRPLTMSLALGLAVVAAVAVPAGSAAAAFPGTSDRLAFQRFDAAGNTLGDVYTITAAGTGETNLTATAASEDRDPAWSADGTKIAFRRYGAGPDQLWTMDADGANLTVVPGSGTASAPAWSPDGAQLAFGRFVAGSGFGTGVYRVPATGGRPVLVTQPRAGSDSHHTMPAWSPDGTRIAYCDLDDDEAWGHIFTINSDGTGNTQVTSGAATDEAPDWRAV